MLSRPKRVLVAQVAAFLYHATVVMIVVVLTRSQHTPDRALLIDDAAVVPEHLVFLAHDGDGQMHGGGEGGEHSPLPASRARVTGRDRTSVPIAQPASSTVRELQTPPDTQQVVLDARRVGSDSTTTPGL